MNKKSKRMVKKVWYFIWEDDSIWSWIVNIVLAFVLIKFIVYPGLGLILSTSHPVVAVVSDSMEHNAGFDKWWEENKEWYLDNGIDNAYFENFPLKNGFNKGDIMILVGRKPEQIQIGDVIVFISHSERPRKDPIIHRVIKIENDPYVLQTKGDKNSGQIDGCNGDGCTDETDILEEQLIGKAVFRVPFLGYIKIWFVGVLKFIGLA
ncbi:MAG: signal peptidase I [Candidatus Woesearchaeota archaeon]